MIRENTINKFQAALEDLELQCKMGSKITNDTFSSRHSITKTFLTDAAKLGVVNKTGVSSYEWTWGAPNRATARRIIKQINKRQTQRVAKKEEQFCQPLKSSEDVYIPAQFPRQEKKSRAKKSVESVSWFWGLYRRTITK